MIIDNLEIDISEMSEKVVIRKHYHEDSWSEIKLIGHEEIYALEYMIEVIKRQMDLK